METTLEFREAGAATSYLREQAAGDAKTSSNNDWKTAEKNRYGLNMVILALTLLPGSMAVPYAVNMGDWQLMAVVVPSIFTLVMAISLAPMKLIAWSGAIALVINLLMFIAGAVTGVIG